MGGRPWVLRRLSEPGVSARADVGSGQYAPAMANFAVRTIHGPGWDPSRPIRELHAVEATDEDEVRARFAADPWASAGLLRLGSVEPWALWLDSRPAAPAH